MSEEQAAEWLAPFADEVGAALERVLAARRYAATGDLRSLQGGYP
ncbi:hypothetical protein [Actinoallomurus spadix]|uniref:Uncharacterized protein n=1 Tax=Actinoallomurus spadix TaxID=79912 RepID=A0ABP3FM88_9ACTN|nr:hypothetical protein [Actinoallomurus spadix]